MCCVLALCTKINRDCVSLQLPRVEVGCEISPSSRFKDPNSFIFVLLLPCARQSQTTRGERTSSRHKTLPRSTSLSSLSILKKHSQESRRLGLSILLAIPRLLPKPSVRLWWHYLLCRPPERRGRALPAAASDGSKAELTLDHSLLPLLSPTTSFQRGQERAT